MPDAIHLMSFSNMIRNKSISTDDDGAELNQENGQVPEAVTPNQSDADAIFADSMP